MLGDQGHPGPWLEKERSVVPGLEAGRGYTVPCGNTMPRSEYRIPMAPANQSSSVRVGKQKCVSLWSIRQKKGVLGIEPSGGALAGKGRPWVQSSPQGKGRERGREERKVKERAKKMDHGLE